MSIKYLGRKVNIKGLTNTPCAQLVNVPELQRNQRCIYCRYWQDQRTSAEIQKCIVDHHCGEESLLYAKLVNSQFNAPIPDADHFSPTPIVRQTEIESEKRYLQLWSCDIDGYQCCKLCHFYPERIEKQQTIAACANSHDCGQNASWLDLLQIKDTILYSMPDYNSVPITQNTFVFVDGTIRQIYLSDIYYDAGELAKAHFSDDSYAYIMNFVDWCEGAGALLNSPWEQPFTWSFKTTYLLNHTYNLPIVLIRAANDPIRSMLIAKSITEQGLNGSLGYQFRHNFGTDDYGYYAERQWSSMLLTISGKSAVAVLDIQDTHDVFFRFGGTYKYLSSPYWNAPPSKWKLLEYSSTDFADRRVIRITDSNSQAAQFLKAIGVRESLFYNL